MQFGSDSRIGPKTLIKNRIKCTLIVLVQTSPQSADPACSISRILRVWITSERTRSLRQPPAYSLCGNVRRDGMPVGELAVQHFVSGIGQSRTNRPAASIDRQDSVPDAVRDENPRLAVPPQRHDES